MPATLADIQRKYGANVMPWYKDPINEPYGEAENGYGYQGVVLYDEIEDRLLSNLDGKWYKKISPAHCKKYGLSTISEYKERFGLMKKIGLVNKDLSERIARSTVGKVEKMNDGRKRWLEKIGKREYKKVLGSAGHKNGQHTMQYKNGKNNCPDQLRHRFEVVSLQAGHTANYNDMMRYDHSLASSIQREIGSLIKAQQDWGFDLNDRRKFEPQQMVAELRSYTMETNQEPRNLKKLLDSKTFSFSRGPIYTNFGSIEKFKMMAGLDQLLAEIKPDGLHRRSPTQ